MRIRGMGRTLLVAVAVAGCSFSIGKPHCANVGDGTKQCFATKQEREEFFAQRQRDAEAAEQAKEQERQREQLEAVAAIRDNALERERQEKQAREDRDAKLAAMQEEDQRKRDEEKAHREKLRELATQKEYAVPILSAMICDEQDQIASYNEDLKREQRIESSSGVRNLHARREIAEGVDDSKIAIKELKELLRARFNAAPEPCAAKHRAIVECRNQASACTDEGITYAEIWRVAPDLLAGE